MTTEDLQLFAKEIGATITLWPTRLTIRAGDCTVCVHVNLNRTFDRAKIARLFIDKIDAVFGASDDLLKVREQLEKVQ